ncbi:MAG: DNA polymerase III subunit delta' [Bradymonadales bacterium]|nr:DNA polymerase III subunit delta' [Bradymonadales bacterium]
MKDASPQNLPVGSFDSLVGHEQVLYRLQEAFSQGRAHHAYLLTGPPGIGKATAARLLCHSLLCQEGTIGHPCHRCPDCIQVRAGSHPDYVEVDAGLAAIKIESIRRLSREWSFGSFQGGARCALLDDAERMTPEAANALLKLLEEPPARSWFFLVAANRSQLLPTVVSRCQHVPFRPLSKEEVRRVLERLRPISSDLEVAATFSGGSPGKALALMEDPAFQNHREFFRDFFALAESPASAVLSFGLWSQAVEGGARSGGGSLTVQREHTRNLLEMLKFLLRDLCCRKGGASTRWLLAPHMASLLGELPRELTWTRLWAMLKAVRDAELALVGNVTPRLVLENLAITVAIPNPLQGSQG